MSKVVKIPSHMVPCFVCEVNGQKYFYPAGTEQEVPEAVASVIENFWNMAPVPTGKPYQVDEASIPESIARDEEVVEMVGDIPRVFIDGMIPTTKDDVLAEMRYISKTDSFSAYLKIKAQGNSSLVYSKKNFTIKMYSDKARENKQKRTFKDWDCESSKYVLKANYIDHSHARNIVSARLWNEAVCSRPDYGTLPLEMRNSPRNGAVDGFPVKLYTNGTYQGIYTWNIGKDDWMWGMDEDNASHVLLCGAGNTDGVYAETPCNFRAAWDGTGGWEIEVGEKSDAVVSSMNALISCVKDTDDDTFQNTIGNHLDVQSAIDYWIHQYIICGIDGLAKNMLLATYDGVKWICGAYDMDSTFGLWWDGSKFVAYDCKCPEDYQEKYSLLWERITSVFSEEIKARYIELRKTVYSYSNIVTHFERFADTIGKDLYDEDLEIYPGIPFGTTSHIKQIRDYIRDRLAYVDGKVIDEKVEYLYELAAPVTLNGTDAFVDTGVKLFDTEKDFSIYVDCDLNNVNTSADQVLMMGGNADAMSGMNLTVFSAGNNYMMVRANGTNNTSIEDAETGAWGHTWENLKALVLVYKNGVFSFGKYLLSGRATPNSIRVKSGQEYPYAQNDRTLTIGANVSIWSNAPKDFITGTLNVARVYDYAMSEEEASAVVVSAR